MQQAALWLRNALDDATLSALDTLTDHQGRPGARIDWTEPQACAAFSPITKLIAKHALPRAQLTRVVGFSKDSTANWAVPWHQDRIIAVAARHDVPQFHNWSCKGDVHHCEPPLAILQAMRFVRVHLDDCDASNGAMEIARGSEAAGLVSTDDAATVAANYPHEVTVAKRGDILVLPMLVLHRSIPSQSTLPRRTLRLDFASDALPAPLSWRV
jgi:hypothetical protein